MQLGELERRFDPAGLGSRIAVIGGGIAGLGAAWLLSRRYEVTLFEAVPRLGGHANTIDVSLDGMSHPVDTGFLVFNRRTYPNLCGLFEHLGVKVVASEMSFSVSLAGQSASQRLEWAGNDLNSLFAQRRNLANPQFIGMVRDILRFNRDATQLARDNAAPAITLGEFLRQRGFGEAFRDWYLLPMAAAIWSCPTQQMLAYPLSTFLRFCHNHGLLQILDRPAWLTVQDGSRAYVRKMADAIDNIRLATPVHALTRLPGAVVLHTANGEERFDQVVFACHSDQALRILGNTASAEERAILGRVRYQANRAVVHTDVRLLPTNRRAWAAWNYRGSVGSPDQRAVSVSYLINRLQPLPFSSPVVVSLNPFEEPEAKKIIADIAYEHPVFDVDAMDAQAHLPMLQGRLGTWYCGAWTRYGFHEDGLQSAVQVAASLGVVAPWQARPILVGDAVPADLRERVA